ncbi:MULTISPECIES: tripartite tricarboxylate transporter substrate binding protein [Ramlibacter]|uniref:Tripartite tricarboxylate transporter substrate binding protein n=1 Tax=Ramlibacter pinisoli TaxID=2682844 RepID=A0A6N8IXW3_9BURK|nr:MULTISPECIES: tripartite tricarboxylate transporter substrate binding protein [Ramlibacter]MBA2961908.1 tripartite tricarboxylate transporter substrate binding protein [Ramlibacter sp. CGMCC 1.13660]MVQ31851.1 tripartite tricarboxylate transporter substrate binding protein [Ramlibacter pinisoli]
MRATLPALLPRRHTLRTAAALLAMLLGGSAFAQQQGAAGQYPSRPVRIIVPSSPGGGTDILARLLAKKLSDSLGQPFIVENRAGAGQALGIDVVSHATPDGYTLLMAASAIVLNQVLSKKTSYDTVRDFAPVSLVSTVSNVLVVNPALPVKTERELIAYAQSHPGTLNYSSAGNGTSPHLSMELFRSMAGITMTHVPYKGSGPATVDLVSGHVQLSMPNILTAMPHIKAGTLRALGVTGPRRADALPDVPTIAQAGLPGYESVQWYGVLAPAGTPAAVVNKLQAEIVRAIQSPEVQASMASEGADPVGSSADEFATFIRGEIAKWAQVVKTAGIQQE